MSDDLVHIKSIESVQKTARKFCSDRQWEKFHLPTSLALALSGECGEVAEIFQWKNELEGQWARLQSSPSLSLPLSEREVVHTGEEIADVCIYTTRLADICGIDLSRSVRALLRSDSLSSEPVSSTMTSTHTAGTQWESLSFEEILSRDLLQRLEFRSPRQLSLVLLQRAGEVATLFAAYPEDKSSAGLSDWRDEDRSKLAHLLATVWILMIKLAHMTRLSIGAVIADKFAKNAAKYPVELARGSSDKYTAYINAKNKVIAKQPILFSVSVLGVLCVVSFLTGRYLGRK